MLAIIGVVGWPSADTVELPPELPGEYADPEEDGVAFPDRFTGPFIVPTAVAQSARPGSSGNARFIRLIDPLDEPEYYCVVLGAGGGVRLQSALQAHTCKPISTAADELFMINHPNEGQIYTEAYDLCIEAEGAQQESWLMLKACSEFHSQFFIFSGNSIRVSDERQDDLCFAVAPGNGIPTGVPSHLRRALTLEVCKSTEATFTGWRPSFTYTRYCYESDESDRTKYSCVDWVE